MSTPSQALEAAIQALQAQRALLGDAVVDAALAPLLAQRNALTASAPVPAPVAAGPALRQVHVLFLDVVGSTPLSQKLGPEDVHEVMDGLLERCTTRVREHGGRVLQYAGDSLLAAFGAERSDEDDAERAVRCALALLAEGREEGARVLAQHGHRGLDVRVGVHTGPVLLGAGIDGDGSIRGMAVNVAARMEQSAPAGAVRISQDTYRQVQGLFELEPQEAMQVKGVDGPVLTWLVRRARSRAERGATRGVEGLSGPMVGRDDQLRTLQRALSHFAGAPRQRRLLVVGEAGLGKSRLLAELARWLDESGPACQRLHGRADPQTQHQPFGLLRDMLTQWLRIDDADSLPTARDKAEHLLVPLLSESGAGTDAQLAQAQAHVLAHLIGVDFADSPHLSGILDDPTQLRARAFHAGARALQTLGRAGEPPLLMTLDDLHWADEGTLDFLDYLARQHAELPLFVLGLTRPALFERRPAWRAAAGPGGLDDEDVLALPALDGPASQRLARTLLQRVREVPPALLALLTERAEGNPFYMEELVNMLLDQGTLQRVGDEWVVDEGGLHTDAVPGTLAGVLQARLDRLPAPERRALQQASVIGAVFWDPALAAIEADSAAQLPGLAERELVRQRPESALSQGPERAFAHHILRDVTYDTVLRPARREWHARAGAWLAAQTGLRAEALHAQVAQHFERAGNAGAAAEHYARAAEAGQRRYAHDAVLSAVAAGLPLLPALEPVAGAALHWRLLDARERTLDLLGRRDEQRADLQALQDLLAPESDERRRADLGIRQCLLALRTGELAAASAMAGAAMAQATTAGDVKLRLNAQRLLADSLARRGLVDEALGWAQSGLSEVRAAGLVGLESRFLNALTVIHARRNHLAALLDTCQQATRLRRELGDRRNEAIGLATLGGIWMTLGRFDTAREVLEQSLHLHRAVGNRAQEPIALANLSQLALWQGDAASARQRASAAVQSAREVQARELVAFAAWCLGQAELALGAPAAAGAAFDEAVAAAGEGAYALDARAGRLRVALADPGAHDAATGWAELETLLQARGDGAGLEGCLAPRLIDLVCWQALVHQRDPRASALLRSAHAALQADAQRLEDAEQRRDYLRAAPEHRDLLAAWAAGEGATQDREPTTPAEAPTRPPGGG